VGVHRKELNRSKRDINVALQKLEAPKQWLAKIGVKLFKNNNL
jgi:hypothetical protein